LRKLYKQFIFDNLYKVKKGKALSVALYVTKPFNFIALIGEIGKIIKNQ